jgi:hypothetical protein
MAARQEIGFGRHIPGRVGVQGFMPNRRDPALFDEELDGLQRPAGKRHALEFFRVLLEVLGHAGSERREGAGRPAAVLQVRRSLAKKRGDACVALHDCLKWMHGRSIVKDHPLHDHTRM